jgi:hypothetical protein
MQLTEHFTLEEFERSSVATRLGIDNRVPKDLLGFVRETAEMLERIRAHLVDLRGSPIPIFITSGFRCLEVNRAVGSGDRSDHLKAMAADWVAPAFGTPFHICRALAAKVDELEIGQLINEYPDRNGWVHTSIKKPAKVVNRIITITAAGTMAGVDSGGVST